MKQAFKTKIIGKGPKEAWAFLYPTFDVKKAFGKAGMLPVKGTVNGFAFRGRLMPQGDEHGTHAMMFNKELQAGAKATIGETVAVVMELDTEPRAVEIPSDVAAALHQHPRIEEAFTALAYTHKKEFIRWISEAKRPETRAARIAKTVEMVRDGKRRN
jgi:hypothetical protein